MKCPRCGLFNPDYAMRCDCGYDFTKKAVDRALDRGARLRGAMRVFFVLQALGVVSFIFHVIRMLSLGAGDATYWAGILVWFSANPILAWQMVRRKNWARYSLVVITFPFGLLLLLGEVKAYCEYVERGTRRDGTSDAIRAATGTHDDRQNTSDPKNNQE